MRNFYLPGIVGFLVCAAALPLVQRFADSFSLYDAPGPLKIHHRPISRLGGLAMMAGLAAGYLICFPSAALSSLLPVLIFGMVWVVGLVDDVKSLPSYGRFCIHITAGAAFWFAGWRLDLFPGSYLDLAATCLFAAFVINSMNLLDGMDGLAASLAAVASLGFLVLSLYSTNSMQIVVASALLGISAGMLTVNAPPAKMFMGDSGSTLIGIVLAFLSLNWIKTQPMEHSVIVVPFIFLAIPFADVVAAVIRRARNRGSLFTGDRRHFYDLLLRREWTVDQVLNAAVGISCLLILVGWLSAQQLVPAEIAVVLVLCGAIAIALVLGSLHPEASTQVKPQHTPRSESLENFKTAPFSAGDGNVNL
jgi:UDP-GlcNAc:undecaprenyl-phosphate GlcNAc-1-phosphate transferase